MNSTTYSNNITQTFQDRPQMQLNEYLTPEEMQAVTNMKYRLSQDGINAPDEKIVMSLMARKFKVDRATELLKNQLSWRVEHNSELVLDEVVIREMRSGKLLTPPARDLSGAQLIYFIPRFHKAKHTTAEDLFRGTYLLLEKLLTSIETQRHGFSIIIDCKNTSWRNFDHKVPQYFVKMMQNRFPARLARVLILYPPRVFKVMYGMVHPIIPAKFNHRIGVIDESQLSSFVAPSQLLREYGGTMTFDLNQFVDRFIAEQYNPLYPQQQQYTQHNVQYTQQQLPQQYTHQYTQQYTQHPQQYTQQLYPHQKIETVSPAIQYSSVGTGGF